MFTFNKGSFSSTDAQIWEVSTMFLGTVQCSQDLRYCVVLLTHPLPRLWASSPAFLSSPAHTCSPILHCLDPCCCFMHRLPWVVRTQRGKYILCGLRSMSSSVDSLLWVPSLARHWEGFHAAMCLSADLTAVSSSTVCSLQSLACLIILLPAL